MELTLYTYVYHPPFQIKIEKREHENVSLKYLTLILHLKELYHLYLCCLTSHLLYTFLPHLYSNFKNFTDIFQLSQK